MVFPAIYDAFKKTAIWGVLVLTGCLTLEWIILGRLEKA